MIRRAPLAAIVALSCTPGEAPTADPDAASYPTVRAETLPACDPVPTALEVVATGLDVPWDVAFLPDGRVLVTERGGRIRVVRDGRLEPEPWAVVDVYAEGEAGLLGIDIAPDFPASGDVFVAATTATSAGPLAGVSRRIARLLPGERGYPVTSGVLKLTDRDGRGTDPTWIVTGVPAGQLHVGGALRFGPDGDLWLGTGDAAHPDLAADLDTRAGSLLRYGRDGAERGGSPAWAHGFRNVQALDWDGAGALWVTDHGPTGLVTEDRRTGHDELNRVVADVHHGWPEEAGRVASPKYRPPVLQWTTAIAPAGMAFWRDPGPWRGSLFVSGLAGRELFRIGFDPAGTPLCSEPLLGGDYGRVRAVRAGPDGWLYFTTSNRDGRGRPSEADDRLVRIRPEAAASDLVEHHREQDRGQVHDGHGEESPGAPRRAPKP